MRDIRRVAVSRVSRFLIASPGLAHPTFFSAVRAYSVVRTTSFLGVVAASAGIMQQAADLRRAFAAFDVSGDGEISRQEFRNIMARKSDLPHQQSVAKADAIFDDFDTNNDGVLSLDEFVQGMLGQNSLGARLRGGYGYRPQEAI